MTADVVVIGGGMTGLVLGHELVRRGGDALVLEADDRVGGVIRSVEREGRILDAGPQRTRLTDGVRRLVERLGLEDELLSAPPDLPLFVFRDGALRRVPFGIREFVRTDLLSWRGKLRFLLEPLTGRPRPGESVADFLERAFGREAYLHLFGPLYGGIYASDPRRMPVERSLARALEQHGAAGSVLWRLLRWRFAGGETAAAVSFRGGMEVLVRELARVLEDRIRTGQRVTSVEAAGDGFRVRTAGGHEFTAARVVLTVPADAAGRILSGLSPETAAGLRRLRYNPLAVVHLLSELDRPGYGFQVSLEERHRAIRGVTWNYSLFDRAGVSTAYLGGALRPEVTGMDDEEVARRAQHEFAELTGVPARPIHLHRTRMPAFDESWSSRPRNGRESDLPRGVHLCASYQVRPGIPGRILRAERLAGEL